MKLERHKMMAPYEKNRNNQTNGRNQFQNNLSYPLYLGGGSGAWTKTVFRQADGEVQKRHKKMSERGALKLTKAPFLTVEGEIELINNAENFYEMGKTCFTITEVATR
ncbi:hypothetical protein HMPREF9384_1722 [Streptococcus sanguinis SK160]|uniref:Uncharacterized protein n=2 Tax=Streptococcus sanguinis TaxID=1305 RepID=F0IV60_STRSA|nr:hypothetical protein HMPREF9384_1722 [Streptococcus sanguinis SK160]